MAKERGSLARRDSRSIHTTPRGAKAPLALVEGDWFEWHVVKSADHVLNLALMLILIVILLLIPESQPITIKISSKIKNANGLEGAS